MTPKDSLQVLINVAESASKAGLLTLSDSKRILDAISILSPLTVENKMPEQPNRKPEKEN